MVRKANLGPARASTAPGVYVGVDSGGTRTSVVVELDSGAAPARRAHYHVPVGLGGALADEQIHDVMARVMAPLGTHLDGSTAPISVWFSTAGFSHLNRDAYVDAMTRVADEMPLALATLGAANDGVSLLLGSDADAIVIAGTGSTTLARDGHDAIAQAGGQEWVACDFGSGFWIGLHGVRQAYRDYADDTETPLLTAFRDAYRVDPDSDEAFIAALRTLAIASPEMKAHIASFAAHVCGAATSGDHRAQDIVTSEAGSLADETAGVLLRTESRRTTHGPWRVVQCGSVLANEFYQDCFEQQLARRLRASLASQEVTWARAVDGQGEALVLAHGTAVDPGRFDSLGSRYRPGVVTR